MKTRLKKTSLAVLPLASLLWLAPNVSVADDDHHYRGAHREWRDLDARHRATHQDQNDEYQQRLQALDRRHREAHQNGTGDDNPEFHRQLERDYREARQELRRKHRDVDRNFNRDYRESRRDLQHRYHLDHDD